MFEVLTHQTKGNLMLPRDEEHPESLPLLAGTTDPWSAQCALLGFRRGALGGQATVGDTLGPSSRAV